MKKQNWKPSGYVEKDTLKKNRLPHENYVPLKNTTLNKSEVSALWPDDIQHKTKRNKDGLFLDIVCLIIPLFIVGIWMILGDRPEDSYVEKASVHAIKAIWGPPAGLTIVIFDLYLLILFILNYYRAWKIKSTSLLTSAYNFSKNIILHAVIILCIIKSQTMFAQSTIIPDHYAHPNQASISLIFITVLLVFGIGALFLKALIKAKKLEL